MPGMSAPTDQIVELDIGIRPGAALSGAVSIQTEESTFLGFNAMCPTMPTHSLRVSQRRGTLGHPFPALARNKHHILKALRMKNSVMRIMAAFAGFASENHSQARAQAKQIAGREVAGRFGGRV